MIFSPDNPLSPEVIRKGMEKPVAHIFVTDEGCAHRVRIDMSLRDLMVIFFGERDGPGGLDREAFIDECMQNEIPPILARVEGRIVHANL